MPWDAALRNAQNNPDIDLPVSTKGKSGTNAQRTEAYGIVFDSAGEARRYSVLLEWQKLGIISHLRPHPEFVIQRAFQHPITKQKFRRITWTADYSYRMLDAKTGAILEIVEDWKGREFPQWKVKRPFIARALRRKILFVNQDLNGTYQNK